MTSTVVLCKNYQEAETLYNIFLDIMLEMDPGFTIRRYDSSLTLDDFTGNRTIFVDKGLYFARNQLGLSPDFIIEDADIQHDINNYLDTIYN